MNKKIAILGAGGHGKVVGEIAFLNKFQVIDFYDDNKSPPNKNFPFKILGNSLNFKNNLKKYDACFIAIGNNQNRYDKTIWLNDLKTKIVNLFHPNSIVSQFSNFGTGVCIMANAVINPGVFVGNGAIINTSASIDHDCTIEEFAHISPNCSLSGHVRVGSFSHIGTGSSVHPEIKIGSRVKIGDGSKVFKDIIDDLTYKE